ncbi:hypothetical protein [Chitinophaga skermanii]|nr:hypothetical protein [Chitinophaga skermanii]
MKLHQLLLAGLLLGATACSKVDYTEIENPAYLRVFNDLNLKIGLENKDEEQPFMCMLIDPVIGADGIPTSAAIKGDFLDQREPYAPPYPSHIGASTSINNPEYPGKENVLVGPVLNGFDLSSWAQVPAGKHRVVFYIRPKNSIPFFNLEDRLKKTVVVDTTIELGVREVYTLHVLQRDFISKKNGIILRQENFHKLSLSDSMLYVNFYNYSANGFWSADNNLKKNQYSSGYLQYGIRDNMNVWMSICEQGTFNTVAGYKFKLLKNMVRDANNSSVASYHPVPVFADAKSNGISTTVWQRITLLYPGIDPNNNPYGSLGYDPDGQYAMLSCNSTDPVKPLSDPGTLLLPNMIVNIHSGRDNPRSFATVNTIEIVNGNAYLTTVQRKYPPPIY